MNIEDSVITALYIRQMRNWRTN